MSISCTSAGGLLQGRASGLSDADRLLLEEHLGSCERCSDEAEVLAAIVGVLAAAPTLRAGARDRAIARALARPAPAGRERAPQVLAQRWVAIGALGAVAAMMALLLWPREARGPVDRPIVATAATAEEEPRILDGQGEVDGALVGAGGVWSEGAPLRAVTLVKARLGHAVVELDGGSVVRWDADSSTLHLASGGARLDVDPSLQRAFRVATDHAVVEVLGTRFEVREGQVSVSHGRVRVTSVRSGDVAELGAGESWTAPSPELPPATSTGSPAALPRPIASSPPAVTTPERAAPHLARARRLLAEGKTGDAARAVRVALGLRPTVAEEAEGRTLLAECALASGDEAEAARRFAEVAERHRELPAGETALFAAARAEERAGRRDAAVALLRRYLASYPEGRFRHEAQSRLQFLNERSPR